MVERRKKADGHLSVANEGKKMIQTGDTGSQMLSLPSLILDTSMRTATDTSWILKSGSCYKHDGGEASEKFIIRVN